ncbi:hypothetical protein HELRODRAFT_176575 [Helobdella robusta]|uniref:Uncharacterized protein n=1 Tax=Helobdella robusta TaxID=6412 RepID=T1FAP0_HELRO|nr:hypothetical protein HELRODRAFT_176575 [Helobdella robusta]ESN99808.1 hypothetical protein HELRODRAFT_176575 [Helobdella robusta]
MRESLRHRTNLTNAINNQSANFFKDDDDDDDVTRRAGRASFAKDLNYKGSSWVFIILVYFFAACFIYVRNYTFPEPISAKLGSADVFSEERARDYLNGFVDLGSRIVGSRENEVLAVQFLMREIEKIKRRNERIVWNKKKIEAEIQTASGSFDLDFLGGFTNVYQNIQNVIVRLSSSSDGGGNKTSELNPALLVNCHYDTFINTPGTSDDAVSCAIMLEVLRALVERQDTSLIHDVIFLFNGAEETILQGSHAFVTSHRWFHDVRAFINLEGAGAGGKELLFQSSSQHPWLLNMYVENVPHPFASILAQEIFQSGLIQSETDFRIFRDFGKLPGLDIAYIKNGYVYHTRHDTPRMIPAGCIQRGGENLFSLVRSIASSAYLTNPDSFPYKQLVFFDLIGYSVVCFRASFLFAYNNLLCLLVHLKVLSSLARKGYLFHLTTSVLSTILSWVAGILASLSVAALIDFLGFPMTWFSNRWLLIGLYAAPSLAGVISVMSYLQSYWTKHTRLTASNMESLLDDGQLVIISTSLLFLSWKQILSLLPSCLLNIYFLEGALNTFIPLMGRAGPSKNPDLIIGTAVAVFSLYFMAYHVSLLMVTRSPKRHLATLGLALAVCFALATLTPVGFPYNNSSEYPANQRVFLQIVEFNYKKAHGGGSINYTLSIRGPNYMSVYISTMSSVYLTWWSIGNQNPAPTDMPHVYVADDNKKHYFIYVARGAIFDGGVGDNISGNYGGSNRDGADDDRNGNNNNNNNRNNKLKQFTLHFVVESTHSNQPLAERRNLEVALLGHHFVNGATQLSPALSSIEQILPDWVTGIISASTYDSWVI